MLPVRFVKTERALVTPGVCLRLIDVYYKIATPLDKVEREFLLFVWRYFAILIGGKVPTHMTSTHLCDSR